MLSSAQRTFIPQTDLSVGILTVLVEGKDWFVRLPGSVFDDSYTVWQLLLKLQMQYGHSN